MTEMKAAMKSKDKVALRGIRAIKAEIMKFKTNGTGEEFTDAVGIKILQKLVKQRQDSLDIYEKQDREDLAVIEREEIAIITKFCQSKWAKPNWKKYWQTSSPKRVHRLCEIWVK